MPDLETLGEFADGRFHCGSKPANRKQQLVLLRLEPRGSSRPFTEAEEAPDLVPKLGQSPVIDRNLGLADGTHVALTYIVARY